MGDAVNGTWKSKMGCMLSLSDIQEMRSCLGNEFLAIVEVYKYIFARQFNFIPSKQVNMQKVYSNSFV